MIEVRYKTSGIAFYVSTIALISDQVKQLLLRQLDGLLCTSIEAVQLLANTFETVYTHESIGPSPLVLLNCSC